MDILINEEQKESRNDNFRFDLIDEPIFNSTEEDKTRLKVRVGVDQEIKKFVDDNKRNAEEKNKLSWGFSKKICSSENIAIVGAMEEEQKIIDTSKILKNVHLDIFSDPSFVLSEEVQNAIREILDFTYQISNIPAVSAIISNTDYQVRLLVSEQKNTIPLPTRLNDLGLPMHLLEIEVAELIERAKAGEQVFPEYKKAKSDNPKILTPVDYLKEYYGKYLKKYNNEKDYLYQFQLQAIDAKFRDNLRMWLSRNGDNINNYIPPKSIKLDIEAQLVVENELYNPTISKKINNLSLVRDL